MPADYTHIRFLNPLELLNIDIEVDAVLVTTSAWYSRELPIVFKKKNDTDRGVLASSLLVQVRNEVEEIESAPFEIKVTAEANLSVVASGETKSDSLSEPTSFLGLVTLSDGVDRIKIVSSEGNGKVEYNKEPIYPDTELFLFQLQDLVFDNLIELSSSEYHMFSYQVGNSDGYEATIYTLTIERLIDTELELVQETVSDSNDDPENFEIYRALIKLKNQYPAYNSELSVDVTETTSTIADLITNSGYIRILTKDEEEETFIENNTPPNFLLAIGEGRFIIEAKVPKALTLDFTLLITLELVNDLADDVGINNFVSLNINN